MGYIYKITNMLNNKIYVGMSTRSFDERFKEHKYNATHGGRTHLYSAMRKYGIDNFKCDPIEKVDDYEQLCLREKYWIDTLHSRDHEIGYNVGVGGEGGDNISALTDEEKAERSKLFSELNLRGICGNRGKKLTASWKSKISEKTKDYYANNKTCWVNNGIVEKRIKVELLDNYLQNGYINGKIKGRQIPWNKGLTKDDPRVRNNIENRNKTMLDKYGTLNGNIFHKNKEEN